MHCCLEKEAYAVMAPDFMGDVTSRMQPMVNKRQDIELDP